MKPRVKLKISVIILAVAIFLCVYYIRVSETILSVGDTDAEAVLSTAIYSVMADLTNEEISDYYDFFTIVKENDNSLSCVITNGLAVNSFTSTVAVKVCEYLDAYTERGVSIPIGVFTGVKLLSGMGKRVNVKLIKISSAKCELVSEFTQAGINQVKHSLYAIIIPDVTLKTFFRSKQVVVEVPVLLYENVIVGKVPETYLGATIVH